MKRLRLKRIRINSFNGVSAILRQERATERFSCVFISFFRVLFSVIKSINTGVRAARSQYRTDTPLHCGKPGRRTCMFSYEPFTAILEVPEVSPEVVWLLWVVGEALGTTSAPLKAQKPAKTS